MKEYGLVEFLRDLRKMDIFFSQNGPYFPELGESTNKIQGYINGNTIDIVIPFFVFKKNSNGNYEYDKCTEHRIDIRINDTTHITLNHNEIKGFKELLKETTKIIK